MAEAVEALVFRIASLTDPPPGLGGSNRKPDSFVNDQASNSGGPRSSITDQDEPDIAVLTRIHQLNKIAFEFYTHCYSQSWAPTYLTERLKTPPDQLVAGWARPGPSNLIRHMASLGVDA